MRLDAGSTTQAKKIPQNTFCSWKIDLNMRAVYVLEVTRDAGATKEIMGLKITGARKIEYVEDFQLLSQNKDKRTERYVLLDSKHLEMFVRNKFPTENPTFSMNLNMTVNSRKGVSKWFLMMVSIMMGILLLCICFCCVLFCYR